MSATKEQATTEKSWDNLVVEAMFYDGCSVNDALSAVPNLSRSSLYYQRKNFRKYGTIKRPSSTWKPVGRPKKITPEMEEWMVKRLCDNVDMRQDHLCAELCNKFDTTVSQASLSRCMTRHKLREKVE